MYTEYITLNNILFKMFIILDVYQSIHKTLNKHINSPITCSGFSFQYSCLFVYFCCCCCCFLFFFVFFFYIKNQNSNCTSETIALAIVNKSQQNSASPFLQTTSRCFKALFSCVILQTSNMSKYFRYATIPAFILIDFLNKFLSIVNTSTVIPPA
jgi:hypothetical protein